MFLQWWFDPANCWIRRQIHIKSIIKLELWNAYFQNLTTHFLAFKTCGTRTQSANVISSPKQYFPEDEDNIFSTASNPDDIQRWAQRLSSHFSFFIYSRILVFWSGWIPEAMMSTRALTWALLKRSLGSKGVSGKASSK